ncbi:Nucleotide-binding universal stress protein, UspA family [Microbulbifer donghaiensis]|uniref:Nucleotide-binding universal stress protein, UspA family n=1 Tax=Microbulbifer donghaiensis TaxID=494016 RepID=A0A1M5CTU1_9GAMM|nr:universal stress protein [Microbulbifer donghaiensis]SHF57762.1 Nucleotide-binding universal stress protein, UspA family [Microbulbifer donghaiensis]
MTVTSSANNNKEVNGHSQRPLVLSCIDGSRYTSAVCDYAAWIAVKISAPLKLLHNIERGNVPAVADLTGSIGLGSQEELLEELTALEQQRSRLMVEQGKLMLQAARERAEQAGVEQVATCQRHDSLSESLIELEDSIRVLVLGIRGEDSEQGLGTQLETVVRSLHKPILVVNRDFQPPQRIMLAYDGSEAARKALALVAGSPLFRQLSCHLVFVGPAEAAEGLLAEASAVLDDAGLAVTASRLEGKTVEALTAYQAQHDIDLTVMGAFSHNRLRDLLLGSITAKMLLSTQQPLLLLR